MTSRVAGPVGAPGAERGDRFDPLETRSADEREAALWQAIPAQIAHARAHARAFAERLRDVDGMAVTSRAALAALPVLRKSELLESQRRSGAADPFGGFATIGWGERAPAQRALRVFSSPGPIHEPESARADYWRMGRALFAAGFRAGDLVHNSFSYHLTPAGSMMESGAHAIGCTVFPAGTGQTELQLQAMAALAPTAYAGTPSFLRLLLEKADETGVAVPSLVKASLSGEAVPAALCDWLAKRGIAAYQTYGTADLGLVAYETSAREGLVVDEGVLVEIVRPGTGDPVADGDVGEVVVTPLFNTDYPLVRLATGDLSAVLPGTSPCGRTNTRLRGWLGRADQTTKVKGMFVHPSHVAAVTARHAAVARARLVVDNPGGVDRMTLEVEAPAGEALREALVTTVREVTKLRGDVAFVAPGSLPNDGKVIDDRRRYD